MHAVILGLAAIGGAFVLVTAGAIAFFVRAIRDAPRMVEYPPRRDGEWLTTYSFESVEVAEVHGETRVKPSSTNVLDGHDRVNHIASHDDAGAA